ncbi:MAG: MlaD family protein [Desulfobacterales bacterium]
MAKQANSMMIGGFVVIAVVLLAASLVVFGSGKFFKQTNEYVLYFDGSIKGLSVGAPVLFQGVQVGAVKSISIHVGVDDLTVDIPVIIEVEPQRFVTESGQHVESDEEIREQIARLIKVGLRAVLGMQSFITGQLMIEIDFLPYTPANLRNIDKDHPEIPTIPSTTQRLAQNLQRLDLEGMQKSLHDTLTGVDQLVNSPDLKASIRALRETLEETREVVKKVDTKIDPLADNLGGTIRDARKLVNNVDRQVDPLAKNVNNTVKDFGKLARDADARVAALGTGLDKTLSAVRGVMSPDAPLIVELESTLQEISATARSFRQLADYLERHPEALIQGKGE